jgi:hypothetical protein
MTKFFISYSRSVKSEVSRLVELLRAKGHDVWWDADISAGQPWWGTILDKIEWCEIFVFVTSEKSVQSAYCMAELKYATDRNRPILPFVIDGLAANLIPPEVTPKLNQWLPYNGDIDETSQQIILAAARLDKRLYIDNPASRPPEPNKGQATLINQFQQAVTLADEGHFDEAIKHFRQIEALDPKTWGEECRGWIAKITVYRDLVNLAEHKTTLKMARAQWPAYTAKYTDDDGLFDPLEVGKKVSAPT